MNAKEKEKAIEVYTKIDFIIKMLMKNNNLLKNSLLDFEPSDLEDPDKQSDYTKLSIIHNRNEVTISYLNGVKDGIGLLNLDDNIQREFMARLDSYIAEDNREDNKKVNYVI